MNARIEAFANDCLNVQITLPTNHFQRAIDDLLRFLVNEGAGVVWACECNGDTPANIRERMILLLSMTLACHRRGHRISPSQRQRGTATKFSTSGNRQFNFSSMSVQEAAPYAVL
jgi:hypothetical protein